MKKFYLVNILLLLSLTLIGQTVPTSYYNSIDGLKKENLKLELGKLVANHTKRSYDQLKTDYKSVYVVTGTKEQVYDLYCDKKYNYSSGGWNREHTVANSYWGGSKNNAYSDLISVIPSETTSNSRKSNYPPAELASVTYDTGRIKIGKAVSGQGKGYSYAWEPYDEFKGDFARIIMYVATCYYNISWNSACPFTNQTWPTMDAWLYKLMLKWHNEDPVCEKEMEINDAVQEIQKNRNPFVDYPILADYIWGELTDQTFDLKTAVPHQHYGGDTPTTAFSVAPNTIDMGAVVTGTTQTATFTVTPQKMVGDITISTTLGSVSTTKIAKSATTSTVVTITYTPSSNGAFSGVVTVTDGQNTRIVNVSGTAYSEIPEGEGGELFVKVSSEPANWNGKYLIVYEHKNEQQELIANVMDGSLTTFDGKDKFVSAKIADNALRSTDALYLNKHAFTFEAYSGGYSIKSASGYYLGHNGKNLTESNSSKTSFSISNANGIVEDSYYLRFNADASMFRFYKSGQKAICLYQAMQLGDVNHDGLVDAADVPALDSFIKGEPKDSYVKAAADMNGDGNVTDADMILLKNKISYNPDSPVLSGNITKSVMDFYNQEWIDNPDITTIDLTGATSIESGTEVKTGNPNTMIYIPSGMSLANSKNVIVDGVCDNLVLSDNYSYAIHDEFTATTATYQRSLSNSWGTICLPYAVNSTSDCQYYRLKEAKSSYIIFEPVDGLAACEPGLFKGLHDISSVSMTAKNASIPLVLDNPEQDTKDPNYLIVGCLSEQTWTNLDPQSSEGVFYLKDNMLLRGNGTLTLPAFRAYFTADNVAGIKERGIKIDEASGISTTITENDIPRNRYNLSGQRVNDSYKGVVILNGKKYRRK